MLGGEGRAVQFACPNCSVVIDQPEARQGKLVACPHCRKLVKPDGAYTPPLTESTDPKPDGPPSALWSLLAASLGCFALGLVLGLGLAIVTRVDSPQEAQLRTENKRLRNALDEAEFERDYLAERHAETTTSAINILTLPVTETEIIASVERAYRVELADSESSDTLRVYVVGVDTALMVNGRRDARPLSVKVMANDGNLSEAGSVAALILLAVAPESSRGADWFDDGLLFVRRHRGVGAVKVYGQVEFFISNARVDGEDFAVLGFRRAR